MSSIPWVFYDRHPLSPCLLSYYLSKKLIPTINGLRPCSIPLGSTGFPALSNWLCFGYTNYIIIRVTQANTLRFNTPFVWDFRISWLGFQNFSNHRPEGLVKNTFFFATPVTSHPVCPPRPRLVYDTVPILVTACVCVCVCVCVFVCVVCCRL
jgi:hypothetical protein